MPDYQTMYLSLFNAVTDAIEMLTEAQSKCEELYIQSEDSEPPLTIVPKPSESNRHSEGNW